MTQNRSAWRGLWPWLPTVAIYAAICWFSAQPGEISDAQSAKVMDLIRNQADWMTALVRKSAHVLLFFCLGAAAGFAWLKRGLHGSPRFRNAMLRAAMLCAALAALDEFHQFFVRERAAQISDVLLDVSGATLGALCVTMIAKKLYGRGGSTATTCKAARKNR